MEFTDYFVLGDFNKKIEFLADITGEKWSIGQNNDNSILRNYIKYTFLKLQTDNQIIERDDYCLLHTGLFTQYYDPIFIYGVLNQNGSYSQKWYLDKFVTDYELGDLDISERPQRANYFQDPSLLVFDVNCDINIQTRHIFDHPENVKRFPLSLQSDPALITLFTGAVKMMRNKVMANYKLAIPQYYDGKIQLLLPLCLEDPNKADIALVVTKSKDGKYYQGHTCLTLEMAYNNARLIARPDSNWLFL